MEHPSRNKSTKGGDLTDVSQITDDDSYVVARMKEPEDVATCINAEPLEALRGITGLIMHLATVTNTNFDDVMLLINTMIDQNKEKEPLEAGTSNGSKQE